MRFFYNGKTQIFFDSTAISVLDVTCHAAGDLSRLF
jgi:hypothetical protein